MKKNVLLLIGILLLPVAQAYDVALLPLFEEYPETGEIEHLFKIENLDYESGQSYSIEVNLSYNISSDESVLLIGNSTHTINKYTTNTAALSFNASSVESLLICGEARVDNDSTVHNNQGCWNLSKIVEEEIIPEENETEENHTENISVDCTDMSITGLPPLSESGEQLKYYFEPWLAGDEVTYWWEDVWGEMVKNEVTTSRNAQRTYTARTSLDQEALVLHAVRERDGCQESEVSELVVILGEIEEEEEELEEEYDDDLEIESMANQLSNGEPLHIELKASKKDNRMRVITIEAAEMTFKMRLKNKGEYDLEIPLLLPCGEHRVEVSGLGVEEEEEVRIQCPQEEEQICEEESEEIISSFYLRAKKWQENITLYGKLEGVGKVCEVVGEVKDSFAHTIFPQAGTNEYLLVYEEEEEFRGKNLVFELEKPSEEKKEEPSVQQTENRSSISLVAPSTEQQSPTGMLIAGEKKERNPLWYLAGVLILLGIGLVLKKKGKDLRKTNRLLTDYG